MIGLVGPDAEVGSIEDAIADAGGTICSGPVADVLDADPDAVVAIGEGGVIDLFRDGGEIPVPVLAVGIAADRNGDSTAGLRAVPVHEARSAVEAIASGTFETIEQPVLGVDVGDERLGRAAFDAMVVTNDPAEISEYRIVAGADLGRVRADGVVVASPAGSHGYARAAGGSRIAATAPVATVVPVAPFTMSSDRWVVDLDPPVEITGERDVDLSVVIDEDRCLIRSHATVSIGLDGTLSWVVPE